MTLTFEDLMQSVPVEQIVQATLDVAEDLELPVTAWQEGSAAREIIYIDATNLAGFSTSITPIARGGLLDYADGDWLTLLAKQVFDVDKILSSAATGNIRLNNAGAVPYTLDPGDVRVLNETTGATYTSASGGTLTASGTLVLDFVADSPGTAGNLVSTDTLSLITTLDGVTPVFDATLLGQDEELDPALKQRCRDSRGRASPNGPASAYDYFAKSTVRPDGTNVGVTRTRRIETNATVRLVVADADGEVIPSDVELIQSTVDLNCVPTGFTAIVQSATLNGITIAVTLTRSPTATELQATIEARVTAAIAEYFSTIGVGGDDAASFRGVYLSTLITVIRVAAGPSVVNAVITSPAADVPLATTEVPVVSSTSYAWD